MEEVRFRRSIANPYILCFFTMESSFLNNSSPPPSLQSYADPRLNDQFYLQKLATHVHFMEE